MELYAYGSLKDRVLKEINVEHPISVLEFLRAIQIPAHAVKLVMINHSPSLHDDKIEAGDRVALFPKEYPFFADWKDYW